VAKISSAEGGELKNKHMKKILSLLIFAAFITGCNNDANEKNTGTDTTKSEASEAASMVSQPDTAAVADTSSPR